MIDDNPSIAEVMMNTLRNLLILGRIAAAALGATTFLVQSEATMAKPPSGMAAKEVDLRARIESARARLSLSLPKVDQPLSRPSDQIAQWYNWPNWGNWANGWRNW